jgi:signal transduction histidine kinase
MSTSAETTSAEIVGVESVITTSELGCRPSRAPDFEAESRVLLKLATTMAEAPAHVLQELVDSARELCRAGSAGVSLLDPEQGDVKTQFRWVATSGGYAPLVGNTLPRNFSPCGTVLDQNRLLLMTDMVKAFPYVDALSHPPREVLLVPFYRGAEPIGTVWVAAHSREQKFDQEDARLVSSLSQFAAAAVQVIQTAESNLKLQEQARIAAERDLERLAAENRLIAAAAAEREQSEAAVRRELKDTRLLRDLAARSIGSGNPSMLLEEILAAAIEITEADAGTIQLLHQASGTLTFLASSGFEPAMSAHFARVDAASGSPCGVALARGEQAFVLFDDPQAPDPDGSLKLHLDAGMRCAQSTPLLSRAGLPLGMFSTHWRRRRELSEREQRFLDLLGRQAADLIERTQVLEALKDSDRRKDEFLAMLAHELRNPLVPIRNGIALVKRARAQPALIDEIHPMMERQIRHAVRLIDDLLDVSRISTGKIELQRVPVTLTSLVESAAEANREALASAGLELQIELENANRLLDVDPTRLPQVISNILHNAIKFTPRGGKITLRSEFVQAGTSDTPVLILKIADTGVGIDRQLLPTIFGLFTQVHSDSAVRHGGLGIGLALARSLVELHGGSISAESEGPGQGSEFIIRIPAPALPPMRTAEIAKTTDNLTGIRVLVVDDNQDAADSIGLLIGDLGADVRMAYDGASALIALKEFDPSLVLLDIGLPDLSGYEACRQIRGIKGGAISIVAVTGWGQDEDRRRALAAGFDAHLTKPVDPDRIAALAAATRAV